MIWLYTFSSYYYFHYVFKVSFHKMQLTLGVFLKEFQLMFYFKHTCSARYDIFQRKLFHLIQWIKSGKRELGEGLRKVTFRHLQQTLDVAAIKMNSYWVHKKCSGLKCLKKDPDYRCTRCQGTACPLDGRPQKEVQAGPDKLEVVASFCYLGDTLSAAGGCELSTTTRVKTAWKKFKDLLPVLSSRHFSFKTRGHVYSSWVRSAMLHASETWPLTKPNLQRL